MKLTVSHLSFAYGQHRVLEDISFSIDQGRFLSVLGPNGVGKSTLFRCILQLRSDYTGKITCDGADVKTLSRRELSRRIAYIPQIHAPTFNYSVLDTVLMGLTRELSMFSQPSRQHVERAMAALERVGAAHLAQRDFTHISGGEQQLVLVARALTQQADLLVMDEPTSALDFGNQLRILQLVRELADEGYSVLLSTHNPQHALTFATDILAIADGRVAALGEPDSMLTEALVDRLYGVKVAFADTAGGRVLVPVMDA